MLAMGQDINVGNRAGQTALHVAALWGNVMAVDLLLSRGANLNAPNRLAGSTPLHMAASGRGPIDKRILVAKKIVDAGADLTAADNGGSMPFQTVSGEGAALV